MVWAGMEGLREQGWFSWTRDAFEGRTPKVTSSTYRRSSRRWS